MDGGGFGASWPISLARLFLGLACMFPQKGLMPFFFFCREESIPLESFETLTVAIALRLWGKRVTSSQVMICIDNEGANFALIGGYSDSAAVSLICHFVALQLDDRCVLSWYSRVPSVSNLADAPSRKRKHQIPGRL